MTKTMKIKYKVDDDEKNTIIIFIDQLFFEQLTQGKLFENAFDKFGVIDREEFDTEKDYKNAIVENVSQIKITPPSELEIAPNGITKKQDQIYWRLEYVYNDRKKWYEVLTEVNKNANEAVK